MRKNCAIDRLVLLRRMPWKILVHSLDDEAHLGHLYQLAREKQVPPVGHQGIFWTGSSPGQSAWSG